MFRSTTPFLKSSEATFEQSFKSLNASRVLIQQVGESGWATFWEGTETTGGGKHYVFRKFRDNRITWAQTLVSADSVYSELSLSFRPPSREGSCIRCSAIHQRKTARPPSLDLTSRRSRKSSGARTTTLPLLRPHRR